MSLPLHPRHFPDGPLRLSNCLDASGRHVRGSWRLTAPFTFVGRRGAITVPEGFRTDLASVPRLLHPLFPPDGEYAEAAVIHDYLCQHSIRRRADAVFLEVLRATIDSWFLVRVLHTAVVVHGLLFAKDPAVWTGDAAA